MSTNRRLVAFLLLILTLAVAFLIYAVTILLKQPKQSTSYWDRPLNQIPFETAIEKNQKGDSG